MLVAYASAPLSSVPRQEPASAASTSARIAASSSDGPNRSEARSSAWLLTKIRARFTPHHLAAPAQPHGEPSGSKPDQPRKTPAHRLAASSAQARSRVPP